MPPAIPGQVSSTLYVRNKMVTYNPFKRTIYVSFIIFALSFLAIPAVVYLEPDRRTFQNLTDMQFMLVGGIQCVLYSILLAACIIGFGLYLKIKQHRRKIAYSWYYIPLPVLLIVHGITIYLYPHLLISPPYLYAMLGAVCLIGVGMLYISFLGWYNYIKLNKINV